MTVNPPKDAVDAIYGGTTVNEDEWLSPFWEYQTVENSVTTDLATGLKEGTKITRTETTTLPIQLIVTTEDLFPHYGVQTSKTTVRNEPLPVAPGAVPMGDSPTAEEAPPLP